MTPTSIEAALHAWVVAGTGLPANQVHFAQQDAPQTRPMVTLRVMSVRTIGQDWINVEDNPDSDGDDGEEILILARGTREAVISIQAFGADAVGSAAPRALLEKLAARSRFPSLRDALDAANIGLAPLGAVLSMDGVIGSSSFDPRATLEARIFITSEVSETATYIESVELENLTTGDEFTVP